MPLYFSPCCWTDGYQVCLVPSSQQHQLPAVQKDKKSDIVFYPLSLCIWNYTQLKVLPTLLSPQVTIFSYYNLAFILFFFHSLSLFSSRPVSSLPFTSSAAAVCTIDTYTPLYIHKQMHAHTNPWMQSKSSGEPDKTAVARIRHWSWSWASLLVPCPLLYVCQPLIFLFTLVLSPPSTYPTCL